MARAICIIGMVYGDEGKGATVDRYTRMYGSRLTVKTGGPQCAHNVVEKGGLHHTFSQFGSGTFAGAKTHLSRHMLINPLSLKEEVRNLRLVGVPDPYHLLTVDREALIINPFQVAANRLRETHRNQLRHGSCGHGIGEAVADKCAGYTLQAKDLKDPDTTRMKVRVFQDLKRKQIEPLMHDMTWNDDIDREWDILMAGFNKVLEIYKEFAEKVQMTSDTVRIALREPGTVIFENGQGVLLDQSFGWFPYVTRRDTTFGPALDLLDGHTATKLGVVRSYATRHGAGPFVTEDASLGYSEAHNQYGKWQQKFRSGHFDLVAFEYALRAVGGVDGIVLTHMDKVNGSQKVCTAYRNPLDVKLELPKTIPEQKRITKVLDQVKPHYETIDNLVELLEKFAPVVMTANGPTAEDYECQIQ